MTPPTRPAPVRPALLRTALAVAALALVPAAAASGATGGVPDLVLDPDPPSDEIDPHVTLDPPRTAAGAGPTDLVVHGRLFGYQQTVAIYLDGELLVEDVKAPQGEFDTTVRLDELPACGPHEVLARDLYWKSAPPQATATFEVTCPELSVTPATMDASTLPGEIVWDVAGFNPGTAVAVRLDDEQVGVLKTDDDGAGTLTAEVGALPCGTHAALAVETRPLVLPFVPPARSLPSATARLTVRCPAPVDPVDPLPAPAVLRLNPVVVAAGTTTRATGSSFPPGSAVALAWVLDDGSTLPAGTVQASEQGTFSTDLLVLVNSGQGPRDLVAGTPSGAAGSDSALVVAGTTQPGRDGMVNRR